MICKKCGTKMEMERGRIYTSIPPQYGFKCPNCGAFEYSTTPDYDDVVGDDDIDDYQEPRKDETPAIPEDMRHTARFPDAEDIVIPGTEQRVSHTEQCEQILEWMKETGRIPIVFVRLDDGVHVEVSDVFDRRIKAILAEGHAIGADARRYTFEKGGSDFWPIGGDICVRAICDETGRSDMYGLGFFV